MNKNKEDIRNSFLVDKNKIIHFKDCSKELQLKIINEIIKIENKRIRLNKILKIISHVFLFMNVFIIVLSIYKNILFNLILSTIATYVFYNTLNDIDKTIENSNKIIELINYILKEIESEN